MASWNRKKLIRSVGYRDESRVINHVEQLFSRYASFKPSVEPYANSSGFTQRLFKLQGTLPVTFHRQTYHIPVAIWLPIQYPQYPPMCFVVPTPSMKIKPRHKHVDLKGTVYHPYLHGWSRNSRASLLAFAGELIKVFGEEPPVYAVQAPSNPSAFNPAYNPGAASTSRGTEGRPSSSPRPGPMAVARRQPASKEPAKSEEQRQREMQLKALLLLDNMVTEAIIREHGFIFCTNQVKAQIAIRLARTEPQGSTAFRDAVALGMTHLLKLKAKIAESSTFDHQLVHVILTDGEDTCSKTSPRELNGIMAIVNEKLGSMIKTFVVGIALNRTAQMGLNEMKRAGGDSVQVLHGDSDDVEKIFQRIEMSLFVREQALIAIAGDKALVARKQQLGLRIERKDFVVLFTLDISGSMAGTRWRRTYTSVMKFVSSLTDKDMLAIVLFNGEAQIITGTD